MTESLDNILSGSGEAVTEQNTNVEENVAQAEGESQQQAEAEGQALHRGSIEPPPRDCGPRCSLGASYRATCRGAKAEGRTSAEAGLV